MASKVVHRSTVAFRIHASFALAAALPLLLLVAISYYLVTDTLRDKALREAHALAKDTAMQVFDRLKFVHDELLILQHSLDGPRGLPELQRLDLGERVHGLSRIQPRQARVLGPGLDTPLRRSLLRAVERADIAKPLLLEVGEAPEQRLFLLVGDAAAASSPEFLAAELNTEYLWDTTQISARPERVCVLDHLASPVYCNGADNAVWLDNSAGMVHARTRPRPVTGDGGETLLTAAWSLFLKPHYQIERWTVLVGIPQSLALSAVHTFEWVFAGVGLIAVMLAILLGSRLIRSNLGPLNTLTTATRQLASGQFDYRVGLRSGDEFQLLGDAFDDMTGRIGSQFNELETLARLDRDLQAAKSLESALAAAGQALRDLLGPGRCALVCREQTDQAARLLCLPFAQEVAHELPIDTAPSDLRSAGGLVDAVQLGAAADDRLAYVQVADGPKVCAEVVLRDPLEGEPALANRVGDVLGIALDNLVLERLLLHQARYDWLSGLPNRIQLRALFDEWTADGQLGADVVAMLLFDLDNFKQINDSQGHNAADELLADVAERLRATLPAACVLSRLAGDEFIVMVRHSSKTGAIERLAGLSEEIAAALDRPFRLGLRELRLSASCGGALYPLHGQTFEAMLQALDAAMYAAKADRRGSFLLFSERMREAILSRIELEQALNGALQNRELLLYYQPVVDAVTGKVRGAEALMRWRRPGVGLVSPGQFMEIAESSGLVVSFGAWALVEACRQFAAWQRAGFGIETVAVNVSGVQLADEAFEHQVLQALDETGLAAHHLALEVTETALIGRFEEGGARLQRLREHGVRVMVDDFGTGYASLKYLKMLPVDGLKIDRLFVKDLPDSPRDEAIIAAVVSLARSSGFKLVAEGVASAQQARFLRDAGVRHLQGFLFDAPLAEDEFAQRLGREQADSIVGVAHG